MRLKKEKRVSPPMAIEKRLLAICSVQTELAARLKRIEEALAVLVGDAPERADDVRRMRLHRRQMHEFDQNNAGVVSL